MAESEGHYVEAFSTAPEEAESVPESEAESEPSSSDLAPSLASETIEEEDEEGEEEPEDDEKEIPQVKVKKAHPLDDVTNEDLIKVITEYEDEIRHLKTENTIFERFLLNNEKYLLEGMERALQTAMKMQSNLADGLLKKANLGDSYSIRSTSITKLDVASVMGNAVPERVQRINLTQKSDLAMKDIEEVKNSLNKFLKKSHRTKCNMRAALEEIGIRENETHEATAIFELVVITEGVDPLTQRIPSEKFVRYMQEWLKSSQTTLQKIRLRYSTLTTQIRKVANMLAEKKELGECLHAVDFEKLQIENTHFTEEIDHKTSQLLDLKKMNGRANLILNNHKKLLQKQLIDLKALQQSIDDNKSKTEELYVENDKAAAELDKTKAFYENIKEMTETYRVPDVMEYVRNKGKLYDLKKNLKIWSRRNNLQNVAFNSSILEMKNITGSKKVLDSWFVVTANESDSDISETFESSLSSTTVLSVPTSVSASEHVLEPIPSKSALKPVLKTASKYASKLSVKSASGSAPELLVSKSATKQPLDSEFSQPTSKQASRSSLPSAAVLPPEPSGSEATASEPTAPELSESKTHAPEPTVPELSESKTHAPEPTVPELSESEPHTPEPSASKPAVPEPHAPEPSASEPAVPEPHAPEPSASEPAVPEPHVPE